MNLSLSHLQISFKLCIHILELMIHQVKALIHKVSMNRRWNFIYVDLELIQVFLVSFIRKLLQIDFKTINSLLMLILYFIHEKS